MPRQQVGDLPGGVVGDTGENVGESRAAGREGCGLSLASMQGAWSRHACGERDHRLLLFA